MNNLADQLISNIKSIIDSNTGNTLEYKKIQLIQHTQKYSSSKKSIISLKVDDLIITKRSKLDITYICITCGNLCGPMNINNIIRKINNDTINCRKCKELVLSKRINHSSFMTIYNLDHIKTEKTIFSISKHILDSQKLFNDMDDVFRKHYFSKNFTLNEFNIIHDKIIDVQRNNVNVNTLEYIPAYKVNNIVEFSPRLYDRKNDIIYKLEYISFVCDTCENIFTSKDPRKHKNRTKIMCKNCNFTNNIFKIRTTTNIIGNKIIYQSNLEKRFIDGCMLHNILLINGPNLSYFWDNSNHTYRVDFELPNLKILIEIKDEHYWHKKQVENGKWSAKVKAVENEINIGNYKEYYILYPKDITNFFLKFNKI